MTITTSQLISEIKKVKSQHGRYTEYKYTTDIDNCNPGMICINLNFYNAETNEYLDCIEFGCFEYSTEDEDISANKKAVKAEIKLKKFVAEILE